MWWDIAKPNISCVGRKKGQIQIENQEICLYQEIMVAEIFIRLGLGEENKDKYSQQKCGGHLKARDCNHFNVRTFECHNLVRTAMELIMKANVECKSGKIRFEIGIKNGNHF